jgi:hypothetical protein
MFIDSTFKSNFFIEKKKTLNHKRHKVKVLINLINFLFLFYWDIYNVQPYKVVTNQLLNTQVLVKIMLSFFKSTNHNESPPFWVCLVFIELLGVKSIGEDLGFRICPS